MPVDVVQFSVAKPTAHRCLLDLTINKHYGMGFKKMSTKSNTESSPPPSQTKPKQKRGFAAMDPAVVREMARKGGKSAHAQGVAHEFTHEEAKRAGSKGGRRAHARYREKLAMLPPEDEG